MTFLKNHALSNILNQIIATLIIGLIFPPSSYAQSNKTWVDESNKYSQILLNIEAKHNPEAAARLGLDGYDEKIRDLSSGFRQRYLDDLIDGKKQIEASLINVSNGPVKQDLQIILDETGAEGLLGNGDMLFLPPGTSTLVRAQGAFISDSDINQCIDTICSQSPPNYLIKSFDSIKKDDALLGNNPKDKLYDDAVQIVVQTRNASTTFLQRKLKIGYARAASLIDELEENGVVGAPEGSKPRRVLMELSDIN